jgi:hypothetical protein
VWWGEVTGPEGQIKIAVVIDGNKALIAAGDEISEDNQYQALAALREITLPPFVERPEPQS